MSPPSPLPPELAEPLARVADRLGPIGGRIFWYPTATSTNDLAAVLAEDGAEEGCVVVADAQSAGRGRHGRTWASPAGAGLYVSVVLKPVRRAVPALTIAAGVALAEGIHAATGLSLDLKWPNDLYAGDRKVAGVLAEAGTNRFTVDHVVLGFGINVRAAAYPPDVTPRATSLDRELGRDVDRGLLFAECLSALARRYAHMQAGQSDVVMNAWRARAASTLGRRLRWDTGGATLEGIAENIDEGGALMVRTPSGIVKVSGGEVVWL